MFGWFKKKEKVESFRGCEYTCSCGNETDLEWCPACGIRNTYRWKHGGGSHRSFHNPPVSRTTRTSSADSVTNDSSYIWASNISGGNSYSSSDCSSDSSSSSDCSSSSSSD